MTPEAMVLTGILPWQASGRIMDIVGTDGGQCHIPRELLF